MAKELSEYRKKRDFGKTPEPAGGAVSPQSDGPRQNFVIHRHEATHLHYDLRLVEAGVLKSWAVPRGFSYDPKEKRLAMQTEDHPLEYEHFDGVIPKGQYGAGTMTIWDRGQYEVLHAPDLSAAIDGGELKLVFYGKRIRGEWHVVKTKQEERGWLLFKARDRYSRTPEESPYPFAIDLDSGEQRELPKSITPMRPREERESFTDPAWVFEMEFAGVRALLTKDGDDVRYLGADKRRLRVPETWDPWREIRADKVLLDGVFVCADENQRPSRERAEACLAGESSEGLCYYAFDCLYYDEWRLAKLPLVERKQLLATLLPPSQTLLYVDHVLGEGEQLTAVVNAAGLPGVVAKKATSSYRGGAAPAWRRIPAAPSADDERESGALLDKIESYEPAARRSRVKFTNRDKVFWPELGYTKGDLVDYYDQVSGYLLPYLQDRPLHMNRFPDGIHGKSFYHKDAPGHTPDWIDTETISSRSTEEKAIRYIVCNDRDTLLYLANLGSVDLHPWLSHRGSLDTPDWLVFDLDPDGSPFPHVVRIARTLGKLLRGIGLRPYLKTSGATGIHIYIPLIPSYTYDQVRMFGEGIARYVVREHPDISTVDRVVGRRQGRVYIDFLQNRRGQTIVPPYSARPVEAASASAPLDWDELDSKLDPAEFHIGNLPDRLAQHGDLFQGTLTDQQDLLPAIELFQQEFMGR